MAATSSCVTHCRSPLAFARPQPGPGSETRGGTPVLVAPDLRDRERHFYGVGASNSSSPHTSSRTSPGRASSRVKVSRSSSTACSSAFDST